MSDATKKLCKVMRRGRGHGYESAMDYWEDLEEAIAEVDETMVELPRDADGVPIRVGDVMEGVSKYDSLKEVTGKVITISFESDGTTDVAIQAWNSDGKSWHRAYLDPNASVYRHHREPTVEDVLEEFVARWMDTHHDDIPALKAEYASKLRLADDGKEQR